VPELPQVHRPAWADRIKKRNDVERAKRNQAKRCYSTNHPTWRKLRARILAQEPLCRECSKAGTITPATDVDHIDGNSFNNYDSNLAPLCKPCHTRKTNAENGAGWQRKTD